MIKGGEGRTQYAVLGLLLQHPMSGYDLEQRIRLELGTFWRESNGSIYPTLRRLLELEHIEELHGGHERGRSVYGVTVDGRLALREWLGTRPRPDVERDELVLRLFLADEESVLAVEPLVQEALQAAEARAAQARQLADDWAHARGHSLPDAIQWLVARAALGKAEARAAWCRDVLFAVAMQREVTAHRRRALARIAADGQPGGRQRGAASGYFVPPPRPSA